MKNPPHTNPQTSSIFGQLKDETLEGTGMTHTSLRALEQRLSSLEPAPEHKRPERGPTLKETVFTIRHRIDCWLRDYTYKGIAVLLREEGVSISENTLRCYHREARKVAQKGLDQVLGSRGEDDLGGSLQRH